MKLDTPLTTDIGIGVQRRVIEPGDSIVDIPSSILPTVEMIDPARVCSVATDENQTSFLVEAGLDIAQNTGAGNSPIAILKPGLWTLDITFSLFPSFSGTVSTDRSGIQLNYQNFSIDLGSAIHNGFSYGMYYHHRFLLRELATLEWFWGPTGAGQTIIGFVGINAQHSI